MDFSVFFPEIKLSLEWILRFFLCLFSATVAGGILGVERELLAKPAGLKTLVFVTVGSSLFAFLSFEISKFLGGDPTRISANIATGIGFLGAGSIIRRGQFVEGLTTASLVWFCGALGILIGAGYFVLGIAASFGGFLFLKTLEFLERTFILEKRCRRKVVFAHFPSEMREQILSFASNFSSDCRNIPYKLVLGHSVLSSGQGESSGIDLQIEYCSFHTKDIPILRSATSIRYE